MRILTTAARFGHLRQLGKAGFAFFAAKGMLWLLLPLLGRWLLH